MAKCIKTQWTTFHHSATKISTYKQKGSHGEEVKLPFSAQVDHLISNPQKPRDGNGCSRALECGHYNFKWLHFPHTPFHIKSKLIQIMRLGILMKYPLLYLVYCFKCVETETEKKQITCYSQNTSGLQSQLYLSKTGAFLLLELHKINISQLLQTGGT